MVGASESANTKKTSRSNTPVDIKVVPVGPSQETVDQIKLRVERSSLVQKELRSSNYRLITFKYLETNEKGTNGVFAPERFRATFYDYTNERTIVADGNLATPEAVRVFEDAEKPSKVSEEEFEYATRLLQQSPEFGASLKSGHLRVYRPMPPVTISAAGERIVNIGLESVGSSAQNQIVGVSFKRDAIVRYANNAPPTSKAIPESCGIPGSPGSTTGAAGQYQLTVARNGTTLWEMLVLRPGASSGVNGSGVEVRDVRYRGKSVLKRGHVPILNVEYARGECGPYRDWQDEEGSFQAPEAGATNPAPGIRILAPGQIATTALETGSDVGNFRGVAIYTQNNETVMVSEMNAGWYRYIMEWRFADDGTIRPRYGFGATNNSCVCYVHNHHAYWRFDFDIVQPNNKIFQIERGRKFLAPVRNEMTTLRNYQTNKSLLIQNASGDEAYMLTPNVTDGKADTYGVSDLWVLRYKSVEGGSSRQNEIDDGITCVTCANSYIQINPFVNGESVENQDSVVWYGTHFIHSDGQNLLDPDRNGLVLSGSHVVGPDIHPVRW
ncbi:MAG TPA: hypothetical protein VEX64_02605 [Pyrinomonadaceae bacterium]|nr:hypothetical protein [Pyrinomonadaceae bacterium]